MKDIKNDGTEVMEEIFNDISQLIRECKAKHVMSMQELSSDGNLDIQFKLFNLGITGSIKSLSDKIELYFLRKFSNRKSFG